MPDEALEEEVAAEETDVISFLAEQQGKEAEDVEVDDDDNEVATPKTLEDALETIEALKVNVAKKNKTIRKRTGAQHRTQDEYDALKERMTTLEAAAQQRPASEGQETSGIDVQEWKDRFEDDQSSIFDYLDKVQETRDQRYAEFLHGEFSKIHETILGIKSDTDPERAKYRDQIGILGKDPRFAGFDDNALVAIAKAMSDVKIPTRGSISGKRVVRKKERTPDFGGLTLEEVRKKMNFKARG